MALLVGATGLLLALVMGAISFSQLNLTQVRGNRNQARNAAEAVIHLAVAEILNNPDYGKPGQSSAKALVSWTSPDGESKGTLTFDSDKADYSTNSLGQDVPTRGSRGILPVHCAQLVAAGTRAGVTTRLLVVLHIPPYPYAVASSGEFQSGGSMLVGQLPAAADPGLLAATPLDLSKLKPGNLGSRSSTAHAVVLKDSDTILGDVAAIGDIDRPAGATVQGQVLAHNDVAPLPSLDVSQFQPPAAVTETLDPNLVATRTNALALDGFYQSGPMVIPQGLELSSGVLYVNGDLTVNGGIHGKGAIFCKGKVTLNGGAELAADNQVAIIASGPVKLAGSGLKSNFQGLIYTAGDLSADQMSVTGALVANGGSTAQGGIQLSRAAAISMPTLDFHAGWLAEQTWRFDIKTQQPVSHNTASMTSLTARSVPDGNGGLQVKWSLSYLDNGNTGTCLLRTDNYNSSGQFQNSVANVDLSDPDKLPARLGAAFGIVISPGDQMPLALGLWMAGLAKSSQYLVNVVQTQPPLTPQQVQAQAIRGAIDLDLNSFLAPEDKIRVLMWKEV